MCAPSPLVPAHPQEPGTDKLTRSSSYIELFKPTATETGVVVSLFTGGAFFGAFFAGPTSDWVGRRWTILIGSVIFILGGCLQTSARRWVLANLDVKEVHLTTMQP